MQSYDFPVVSCFFLFFAMLFYWVSLAFVKKNAELKMVQDFPFFSFSSLLSNLPLVAQFCVLCSNICFGWTLLSRWIEEGYFPLSNLYESLIFLSWGISFIHLIVEFQTKSRLIGALSSPLLFFISGFASLTLPIEMQKALPLVPSLQSNWLMMHVSMMMISYATLIIGSLFSLLYCFLYFFRLEKNVDQKENQVQSLSDFTFDSSSFSSVVSPSIPLSLQGQRSSDSLEPISEKPFFSQETKILAKNQIKNSLLQTLDNWSYRIIGLGFPFLTIGILSGAVWANEAWGSYWSWDPKETWAFITWVVFAIYLHSRLVKGWQGQKAASLGSLGFFVIWICYLGVNFLGKGLHTYGWVL